MRSRSSSYCLALFLFIPSIATQTCSEPRSANCCENNSTIQADSSVPLISPTDLNCCFEENLCQYSQGCVDSSMGNWSANNGYASARQITSNKGAHVYSVLESPWVNFSKPSCVEFAYSRRLPYQLHVFIAFSNVVQPCLIEDSGSFGFNENRTVRFRIDPLTVKIQFRVVGGGAGSSASPPKLYHVTVLGDDCVYPDGDSTESLTNPLHTSTPRSEVSVTTTSSNTSYPTTIDTTGPTATVGNTTSPDGDSTSTTRPKVSVNTTSSGTSHSTTSEGTGPSTTVGDMTPTDADSTASHAQPRSTCPTPTKGTGPILSPVCHMTSPEMPPETPDGENDNSAAVIAGVMVTAVVLIVVIIVVVIVYKRKRRKGRGSGSDGARQRAVYENQGFHGPPVVHPVKDSSVVNAREMSDLRDLARASDASNEYLTPTNVYDGLANRNIEENPYNALANQNSTYEGLSPNRNENRLYDSLVANGGQSEDYEIPDTTGSNKERVTEVNRDSDEYYNQASSKMTGNSSLSHNVPSSKVSEYQNG